MLDVGVFVALSTGVDVPVGGSGIPLGVDVAV